MKRANMDRLNELSRLINEIAAQIVKTENEKLEAVLNTLKGLKQIKDAQDALGTKTS